jgi:3-methyladenine DNA glycosylase AlkD
MLPDMNLQEALVRLKSISDPEIVVIKQRRFGIVAKRALGIYQKDLEIVAKEIGINNQLALELFESGVYESKLLCSKICDPAFISNEQMNRWVSTFDNWEICDSFCMGVFTKTRYALPSAFAWAERPEEYVKRAGFVIMAAYGFADKTAPNDLFEQFLPAIEREAKDDRIYVKKAVNWALRNIGKRNIDLRKRAIDLAYRLLASDNKSAKWIGKNALNELESADVHILNYPRITYGNPQK